MEDLQNAWGNLRLERFSPRAFERGLWGLLKRGKDEFFKERAIEERKKKKSGAYSSSLSLKSFLSTMDNLEYQNRGKRDIHDCLKG